MNAPVSNSNRPSAAPGNYVRISRELADHPIVGFGQPVKPADPSKGSYSRAEAWLFLVFQARWQTAEVNNRGRVITLERGELLGARAWLSRVWNWTENQVRGFLDKLEAEMMIDRKNHQSDHQSGAPKNAHFANVLSICKYDIYQLAIERFCEEKNQSTTIAETNEITNQPPHINKGKDNIITTLENHNYPLPPLDADGQDEGVFWEGAVVKAVNGSRLSLERLLNDAGTLDEVLIEVSPKIPNKIVGRELLIAVSAAVAEHARELELIKTKRGTRLPRDWRLPKGWGEWAMQETGLGEVWVRTQAEQFRDYWIAQSGRNAAKLDWKATWRNWVRNAKKPLTNSTHSNIFDQQSSRNLRFLESL